MPRRAIHRSTLFVRRNLRYLNIAQNIFDFAPLKILFVEAGIKLEVLIPVRVMILLLKHLHSQRHSGVFPGSQMA